jgi:hypothetical protein
MSTGLAYCDLVAQTERLVLMDYVEHLGKVLLAYELDGYIGDTCFSDTFHFKIPIRVRVVKTGAGLYHRVDDWFDPYWDVVILDNRHPELPAEGLRSGWVFGPSRNIVTGEIELSSWRRETWNDRLASWFGWRLS